MRRSARSSVLALAFLAGAGSGLSAHSWYPHHCCDDRDCRKVDRIDPQPDGSLLMHFGGQQVIVPKGFEQLPSQDTDAHVCTFRNATGRHVPRCVFMPANS